MVESLLRLVNDIGRRQGYGKLGIGGLMEFVMSGNIDEEFGPRVKARFEKAFLFNWEQFILKSLGTGRFGAESV